MFINTVSKAANLIVTPLDVDYIEGTLEHLDVPLSTDSEEYELAEGAFYNLLNLKSVYIPKVLVEKLRTTAFSKNKKLQTITIQCDEAEAKRKPWYKNAPWGAPSTCKVIWDAAAKPKVKATTPQPLVLPMTTSTPTPANFRYAMRELLGNMRDYLNTINYPDFQLINNGGIAIFDENPEHDWLEKDIAPLYSYVNAVTVEDVFYGTNIDWEIDDNNPTPEEYSQEFVRYLQLVQRNGLVPMVLDYCSTPAFIDDSFARCKELNMLDYCADVRELTKLTDYPVQFENSDSHYTLKTIKNYAILLNSWQFRKQEKYLNALADTNYDCLIIDLLGPEHPLTPEEVEKIHYKKNGGRRILICYMSLGEAETYRTYWNRDWSNYMDSNNEDADAADRENAENWKHAVSYCEWIDGPNGDWVGNFKVRYWTAEWQKVLFGTSDSYIDILTRYGFDGCFLDVIDAYEYFESKADEERAAAGQ